MATNTLGRNIKLPIYNADGTLFNELELTKFTSDSVVMSLGDKITGDVYYRDNSLVVTMQEYVVVKQNPADENEEGVKYSLVSPPTIVREGMVSDNSQLKGMTKYSFTFYHPMYMLGNFPFTDIAVTNDEKKYLSQNKTFSWIGNLEDFVAKLNANLDGTEWKVEINIPQSDTAQSQKAAKMSDVLSFDKQYISDALKTAYDTWEIPFVITSINENGKKFLIQFGLPTQEIYNTGSATPFVFQFGKGVGLKNNSRTPRNNKIITRLSGYGSDRNVPFGYPQIVWTGNQEWDYTINNDSTAANSYPIYDGIVGGQKVRLIKHPFTRTTLMPSVYVESVNKKVNPNATGYDPNTVIIDYYDAPNDYPNPINPLAPSFEMHQFEDIYPRLGDNVGIVSAQPIYMDGEEYKTKAWVVNYLDSIIATASGKEKDCVQKCRDEVNSMQTLPSGTSSSGSYIGGSYTCEWMVWKNDDYFGSVKYTSPNVNFEFKRILHAAQPPVPQWDDSYDAEKDEYVQSYFKVTLPQLGFDIYASASATQEMNLNMRSGACLGCTFPIQVDWDEYKRNFYKSDGTFDPVIHTTEGDGHVRDGEKYPDSSSGQIDVIVKKEIQTFGTLMPNTYQKPIAGDKFVILGISLPTSYITAAQQELDSAMQEYILENNVHYYDYPLKFDEYFLATHTNILSQIKNNSKIHFQYAGSEMILFVKQITIKYGDNVLPQYDITLTDDIEIVLNQIGQVTDDVSRMRVQVSELQKYYSESIITELNQKLSRVVDDVCLGRITFQQGLNSLGSIILSDEIRSQQFDSGLYTGQGWRIDQLGNAELESLRVRSYLEVVELLINRLQAQEGDTLFTDNDQIDNVQPLYEEATPTVGANPKALEWYERTTVDGSYVYTLTDDTTVATGKTYYYISSYILTLKEKYEGYFTSQMYGNVIKGIINTLAAKEAGVSDESTNNPNKQGHDDGGNKYYTSWMRVIATDATSALVGKNQIQVVLYGDNDVPSGKNFKPCELMTIARWGCVNYGDPSDTSLQESIKRRQRMFMISSSEGRVVKYTGVDAPMLKDGNYGVTIGELPEFVKNYAEVREVLDKVGEHTDWLYAQGIVVGNYVKIDRVGLPVPVVVFCGDWIDGANRTQPLVIQVYDPITEQYVDHTLTFPIPAVEYEKDDSLYIGHGIYFYNKYNALTQQYEIHEVRNLSGRWKCLQSQPVKSGNTYTFYEPKWNSPYWQLVDGNENLSIEFVSSMGFAFRRGYVDTIITPHLFYGNVDITNDVAAQYWNWSRESESGKTVQDETWDALHTQMKQLHLTNNDMPSTWSSSDKAIFTCTVTINDGKSIRIVDNQIIS